MWYLEELLSMKESQSIEWSETSFFNRKISGHGQVKNYNSLRARKQKKFHDSVIFKLFSRIIVYIEFFMSRA